MPLIVDSSYWSSTRVTGRRWGAINSRLELLVVDLSDWYKPSLTAKNHIQTNLIEQLLHFMQGWTVCFWGSAVTAIWNKLVHRIISWWHRSVVIPKSQETQWKLTGSEVTLPTLPMDFAIESIDYVRFNRMPDLINGVQYSMINIAMIWMYGTIWHHLLGRYEMNLFRTCLYVI